MPPDLLPVAVLLAIAPGYLTIYFAIHGRTGQAVVPDLILVLQSLVISAVILAALGPFAFASLWPYRDHLDTRVAELVLWGVVIFMLSPYVAGTVSRTFLEWMNAHPDTWPTRAFRVALASPAPPTLWDWSSLRGLHEGRFVVIEYADGHKIGGAYGRPGVVITSPEEHGIFLATEWTLNEAGVPTTPVADSAGVLVPLREDVRSIRLFNPGIHKESDTNVRKPN